MNGPVLVIAFALVALAAPAVVFTRDVRKQVAVFSAYGVTLAILFTVLHAPDVALSEIAVGTVAMPFVLLATLVKIGHGDR